MTGAGGGGATFAINPRKKAKVIVKIAARAV
jgi:galactokinase